MSSYYQQRRDSSATSETLVVLVENQRTGVSQRATLRRDPDCLSYVNILAALELQLAPLLSDDPQQAMMIMEQIGAPTRISLPPESTNLFVLDQSIGEAGTYLPLINPYNLPDRSRLLIDFVPPQRSSASRSATPAFPHHHQQQRQQQQQQQQSAVSTTADDSRGAGTGSRKASNASNSNAVGGPPPPPPLPPLAASINNNNYNFSYNSGNSQNNSRTSSRLAYLEQQREAAPTPVPPTPPDRSTCASPLAVEPETLIIEAAAQLLAELAPLTLENTHPSFVSNAVERRLARLPSMVQERAVTEWSRAIAEGQTRRVRNPLQATLDAVLQDRHAVMDSLRQARIELDELRAKLGNASTDPQPRTPQAEKQQQQQQQQQQPSDFVVRDDDDDDDGAPLPSVSPLNTPHALRGEGVERVTDRPQSTTPMTGLSGGSRSANGEARADSYCNTVPAQQQQQPQPASPVHWSAVAEVEDEMRQHRQQRQEGEQERSAGEADPGKFLREEIADDDGEADEADEAKFLVGRGAVDRSKRPGAYNSGAPNSSLTSTTAAVVGRSGPAATVEPALPGRNDHGDFYVNRKQQPSSTYISSNKPPRGVGGTEYRPEQLPSARPLSATLRQIMKDTSDEARKEQEAGSNSYFVSRIPQNVPDKNAPQFRRVGIVYSDPALAHLPGGPRGTKSFLVPDPPAVKDVVEGAAAALMVSSNPSLSVAVGYWGADGVTPVVIHTDAALQRYLSDQPRVVPFAQVFIMAGNTNNNNNSRGSATVPGTSTYMPIGMSKPSRPVSAPVTRIAPRQAQQISTTSSYVAAPAAPPNAGPSNLYSYPRSQRTETINVVRSSTSEQGLEVLAPLPSAESTSSPWRLRVDSTPPPVASAAALTGSKYHAHAHDLRAGKAASSSVRPFPPDNVADPSDNFQPIHQRPTRPTGAPGSRASTSIVWAGLGAPRSTVLFGGGVDDAAVSQLFDDLCAQAGTSPDREGLPPAMLLQYLDANFDNMGDRRRFERLIGPLFMRRHMRRDELVLVMLRLAKE